jgi:hypothetical protein
MSINVDSSIVSASRPVRSFECSGIHTVQQVVRFRGRGVASEISSPEINRPADRICWLDGRDYGTMADRVNALSQVHKKQ